MRSGNAPAQLEPGWVASAQGANPNEALADAHFACKTDDPWDACLLVVCMGSLVPRLRSDPICPASLTTTSTRTSVWNWPGLSTGRSEGQIGSATPNMRGSRSSWRRWTRHGHTSRWATAACVPTLGARSAGEPERSERSWRWSVGYLSSRGSGRRSRRGSSTGPRPSWRRARPRATPSERRSACRRRTN